MQRIHPLILVILPFVSTSAAEENDPTRLLSEAVQAKRAAKFDVARALATQALTTCSAAITQRPDDQKLYAQRSTAHSLLMDFEKAIADLNKSMELGAEPVNIYDERGDLYFKFGKFKEAVADYDRFLKLEPRFTPRHWRRGIAYYYTKQFVEGQKQFEGYQTFDSNDVENAVWRYLCMARKFGPAKARNVLLKIGDDRRVPMRQIYELFAGNLKPDDVLDAARAGNPSPEKLNRQLFYAHLYLGLYFETEKKVDLARQHMFRAEEKRIGHFMWDVAHLHAELFRQETKRKEAQKNSR